MPSYALDIDAERGTIIRQPSEGLRRSNESQDLLYLT
jgi:hypothetical protein